MKADEDARRKPVEEEMKKVHADLLRVRANRDNFQKKLEVFLAQEAKEKAHIKQMETLNISRAERIKTLESELQRLKVCMAGNSGELGLVEFFKHSENDNPYQSLASKLQSITKENALLQETISSIKSDNVLAIVIVVDGKFTCRKEKIAKGIRRLGKVQKAVWNFRFEQRYQPKLATKRSRLKKLYCKVRGRPIGNLYLISDRKNAQARIGDLGKCMVDAGRAKF
jgi:hypothetical protein